MFYTILLSLLLSPCNLDQSQFSFRLALYKGAHAGPKLSAEYQIYILSILRILTDLLFDTLIEFSSSL